MCSPLPPLGACLTHALGASGYRCARPSGPSVCFRTEHGQRQVGGHLCPVRSHGLFGRAAYSASHASSRICAEHFRSTHAAVLQHWQCSFPGCTAHPYSGAKALHNHERTSHGLHDWTCEHCRCSIHRKRPDAHYAHCPALAGREPVGRNRRKRREAVTMIADLALPTPRPIGPFARASAPPAPPAPDTSDSEDMY